MPNIQDAYDHTTNLQLPLYNDATPMDLRDGYNRAMRQLDMKIRQLETMIREAKA